MILKEFSKETQHSLWHKFESASLKGSRDDTSLGSKLLIDSTHPPKEFCQAINFSLWICSLKHICRKSTSELLTAIYRNKLPTQKSTGVGPSGIIVNQWFWSQIFWLSFTCKKHHKSLCILCSFFILLSRCSLVSSVTWCVLYTTLLEAPSCWEEILWWIPPLNNNQALWSTCIIPVFVVYTNRWTTTLEQKEPWPVLVKQFESVQISINFSQKWCTVLWSSTYCVKQKWMEVASVTIKKMIAIFEGNWKADLHFHFRGE